MELQRSQESLQRQRANVRGEKGRSAKASHEWRNESIDRREDAASLGSVLIFT
jgi:hypothetical protein